MLLRLDDVSLAFGSRPLLERVSLWISERERVCLVGRNGEGKSSLLRLVAGETTPDDGSLWCKPGARLAFLPQDLDVVHGERVIDVVRSGLSSEPAEHWELDHRVDAIVSRLQLDPEARFVELSGGWRRRALLGRALVSDPDILLLDEPTNHLDITAIEWLESQMVDYRGALLFVSHDRAFVNRLATRVVELDRGRLSSWPGNYDEFVRKKTLQLENEAKERALFDKRLAEEEVWIRKGVEARRTRNEGRVRALMTMRQERRARRERIGQADFEWIEANESGQRVFEAERVGVRFGERWILRDFSVRVRRGDRIGIVGPNGAGKSTLIRALLGELSADEGVVRQGTRLEVAYYDQQREQLDLEASVSDNLNGGQAYVTLGSERRHVSGYLREFLFRPDQLQTPVKALSGGERNRLMLARLFSKAANLLVLDEPTNDLDIDTLELLEERIADFSGTLLLVSHDRRFLDRVVTQLLVLDGSARVQEFVGGWSDWAIWSAERDAARSDGARRASSTRTVSAQVTISDSPPKARRLSFKEQREFDALPGRIEALESEKTALESQMSGSDFYVGGAEHVRETVARFEALGLEIDAAYQRWAELESLRS